jgi:hypothetical protein
MVITGFSLPTRGSERSDGHYDKAEFIVITGIALTDPRNSKIPVTFALEMAYSGFLFQCLWKPLYDCKSDSKT